MEPLNLDLTDSRPALRASEVNLSAALLLTGCECIDIQAHSRRRNQDTRRLLPENCDACRGPFLALLAWN